MTVDPMQLPPDLPEPKDDGAAAHLRGRRMPSVRLPSTQGGSVDLAALPAGSTVIFAYPMTGKPGIALPDGWDDIPGARGCTPQNCAFRDAHAAFRALGASVLAVSTQTSDDQREMAARLHVPYAVLSDAEYRLAEALALPTFEAGGMRLLRRLTMIVEAGIIGQVFYPVFPPDRSAAQALDWLQKKP